MLFSFIQLQLLALAASSRTNRGGDIRISRSPSWYKAKILLSSGEMNRKTECIVFWNSCLLFSLLVSPRITNHWRRKTAVHYGAGSGSSLGDWQVAPSKRRYITWSIVPVAANLHWHSGRYHGVHGDNQRRWHQKNKPENASEQSLCQRCDSFLERKSVSISTDDLRYGKNCSEAGKREGWVRRAA